MWQNFPMLCANATLTAGPRHKRYKPGTAVRAVVFMKGLSDPRDLQGEDFKPIAARGWKQIHINGHKLLADDHKFGSEDGPEAQAFRAAMDKGIGIMVLGLAQ